MYTVIENARIVIALLKKHNIRRIVLSPGGSNIPIVQGVQQDPFFTCYSVVDERSAMYFAIGLWHETGEIIATSCTTAQATRNYLPGLTEAFYKHAPVLAITMSKHPRYLLQEYMQCPIQTSLPIDSVKKSFSLPRISTEKDRELCIRAANEAILEVTRNTCGPVQLNIEVLDSETYHFDAKIELPDVRAIFRYDRNNMEEFDLKSKKIMLLIGEHRPFCAKEQQAIELFCEKFNVLVYVSHISNYHGKYTILGNPVKTFMSNELFRQKFCPDLLITIGGLTGDYPLFGTLSSIESATMEHWRIDDSGQVVDTYAKLTKVFQMSIDEFCAHFAGNGQSTHSYYNIWKEAYNALELQPELPLSNMYAAQQLHDKLPRGSRINFAILNSLRVWGYFPLDPSIVCSSNVAAFGIDGCMSCLIGQSVATDNMAFQIIGDLAFLYDINSIGIRHIKNNLRILLINNNGGGEFKIAGNLTKYTDVNPYIAAEGHFKNAKGWAESCGFDYLYAKSKDEFNEQIREFVALSDKPMLFEIFVTSSDEIDAAEIMRRANHFETSSDKTKRIIKERIKNICGDKGVNLIKRTIGK